ncbi:phycobilisome protein [Limnofasciculus baicalensis]|uniref:Phycobilisome protein n=1 Tax=Limnofasciculus baicalensis BBK-W-15 TaxID=2699891 RepID=A0AAE3GUZ8_9CYAN|nr:phycobilisome protein [Limnofasciculus baicalensis]MCP2730954.1 phycobilisome protein [Limnofasciculus baicalensis BBK-W-15]
MTTQLSARVKELIAKSRIVSFASWEQSYPKEVIQLFQTADDEGRYLTDEDLEQIGAVSPETASLLNIARFLRDRVSEIVVEAREQVLLTYPDITQPGGGLYPPERAEACWRDFWHFLRCITYGIAGGSTDFTSSEGLQYMNLLYQELQVPLDAMVLGLENLKSASLRRLPENERDRLTPYFDRLINQLRAFS